MTTTFQSRTVTRRTFLLGALAAGAGCSKGQLASLGRPDALRKAAAYLWDQQDKDGGWHSTKYGLLRSGQSLTGLVLNALLDIPKSVSDLPRDHMMAAVSFLNRHIDSDGAVGRMDPDAADYPNYATALALKAFCRAPMPLRTLSPFALVECLRRQQFTEANGWKPEDPAYGGWGMGGDLRTPPAPGHVDLSMTRHVLEALAASGVQPDDPVFEKASVFLKKCQNFNPGAEPTGHDIADRDGGFYFSPVVVDANKAGRSSTGFRSYGSPTADGTLALLAIGRGLDDTRVRAAADWLQSRHSYESVPDSDDIRIGKSIRGLWFYYAAASTTALSKLGLPLEPAFTPALCERQRADGSWVNTEKRVKEDEPLIATSLAVRALAAEMESEDSLS
jgi:squalene-hopene/tetraprenyl-beta-curcumene cyclase